MTLLASILAVLLGLLLLLQAVPMLAFARQLRRRSVKRLSDGDCPPALVVLCLRGRDPFLETCLRGLFTQDYPHYRVRIVVDQVQDPAYAAVTEIAAQLGVTHVEVEVLREPLATCALKCSSLVQALSDLEPEYQVVALLDADTNPHPTWLRTLVAPLQENPRVGAAAGNRWYMPAQRSLGSLVRYVWNAGAVVQMYHHRFTWGGSLALRAEIVRQGDLVRHWRHSICDDVVLCEEIRRQNYQTAFVPDLMMVNREQCTLGEFFRWVQRQLLLGRLYHSRWPLVLGHGVLTTLALSGGMVLALGAALQQAVWAALLLGGTLAVYLMAMFGLLMWLEAAVRRVVQKRSEPTHWLGVTGAVQLLAVLPLTQWVYAAALAKVVRMRVVEWRGVSYRIDGPHQVRMVDYRPFSAVSPERDSLTSI